MKTLLFTLALTALLPGLASAQAHITLNGSTTMLPTMHALVESYAALHKDVAVTVTAGGSSYGIKALIEGYADIAMSSRELRKSETRLAADKNVRIVPQAVALDALCPIVNPANPVKGLTLTQLRDIFSGKITNWREVGGDDKEIAVVSRDTSSGSFAAWREMVMGGEEILPGAVKLASSGAVLQSVAGSSHAIGYEGLCYVTTSVKALDVDGVAGTAQNARSGLYALSRTLWLFTRQDAGPHVTNFIDYVLHSPGCGLSPASPDPDVKGR